MSEIESTLDQAGMAFMLCGDDDAADEEQKIAYMAGGTERTRRAEIITGLEKVASVNNKAKFVGEWRPEDKRKGVEIVKAIGGKDFGILTEYGWRAVELKSIGSFLERHHKGSYHVLNNDHGTVYVELYNSSGEKPGWMIHYLSPDTDMEKELDSLPDPAIEKKNSPAMIRAHNPATPAPERFTTYVKPHYLIYLLFADEAGTLPFAAISFEWDSFKEKLSDLTGEAVSEVYWMFLPDEAAQILEKGSAGVCSLTDEGRRSFLWMESRVTKAAGTGYCWHIPMNELADIARVTMIGDEAQVKAQLDKDFPDRKKLIDARYQWLKDHSDGRHIDT